MVSFTTLEALDPDDGVAAQASTGHPLCGLDAGARTRSRRRLIAVVLAEAIKGSASDRPDTSTESARIRAYSLQSFSSSGKA